MKKLVPIEYSYDAENGSLISIKYRGSGWAVLSDGYRGHTLNKYGEWEYEPQPSSRDEAYYQRNRYETLEEAIQTIEKFKR